MGARRRCQRTRTNATEGSSHAFAIGSFVDAGANDSPWAVEIDWGDGSSNSAFHQATSRSVGPVSHNFADNGVYTVTVYVTADEDTPPARPPSA